MVNNIKKGDKVFFTLSRTTEPEFEVHEVFDYGELCRLKHIETGAIQQGVVRTEKLVKGG